MADAVIRRASCRRARPFGRLRILPYVLVVGALGQDRERAPEVGVDDSDVRVPRWDRTGGQPHGGDRALYECAHHPGQVEVADGGAPGVARWVHVQHGAPSVEFGEDRLELGLDRRPVEDGYVPSLRQSCRPYRAPSGSRRSSPQRVASVSQRKLGTCRGGPLRSACPRWSKTASDRFAATALSVARLTGEPATRSPGRDGSIASRRT
jgi:hypothetical protein